MMISNRPIRFRFTQCQSNVYNAGKPRQEGGLGYRFRGLCAGRRTGKTTLMIHECLGRAVQPAKFGIKSKRPKIWYIGPTYKQAKRVIWEGLCDIAADWAVKRNETELSMTFASGGMISLCGADNPNSLRGSGLDFAAVDELADIKNGKDTWEKVIRPMLSDRLGGALIGGTPRGRNHFYELWKEAGWKPGWTNFTFTTAQGGIVKKSEIATAREELDEKSFKQEYEASFETFAGLVYYAFSRELNVKPCSLNPQQEILWCLDFNVDPMCSVIAQMHPYGSGRHQRIVEVCDEIAIPNSNVYEACEAFARKVGPLAERYGVTVTIYADASGDSRNHVGTTAVQAIKQWFARHPNYRTYFKIPQANPAVADRVRTVNSVLRNVAGEVRMQIDPKCKRLIADLEQVEWANEMGLEINKSDPKLTHISDALGYMTAQEFHEGQGQGIRSTIIA